MAKLIFIEFILCAMYFTCIVLFNAHTSLETGFILLFTSLIGKLRIRERFNTLHESKLCWSTNLRKKLCSWELRFC